MTFLYIYAYSQERDPELILEQTKVAVWKIGSNLLQQLQEGMYKQEIRTITISLHLLYLFHEIKQSQIPTVHVFFEFVDQLKSLRYWSLQLVIGKVQVFKLIQVYS